LQASQATHDVGVSGPSDELRDVYERRGELEYAVPPGPPDPIDRKFACVSAALASALPCASLLDAGCGDGRYLAALPTLGPVPARVVGIDIADSILRTAAAAAGAAGVDVELVRANLEALPFPDGHFDVVLCTQAIEHVLDVPRALLELRRVLQPGGTLVISTDNSAARVSQVLNAPRAAVVGLLGLRGRRRKVDFPHRSFGKGEFDALLRAAGFEVRRTETFRFHCTGAPRAVQHLLNRLDDVLPAHPVGDILLVEARA
jgi:2-polyprenyl-3-methyl-5-hydroxy-6-metoxy-1,4-benzoquinol methylase